MERNLFSHLCCIKHYKQGEFVCNINSVLPTNKIISSLRTGSSYQRMASMALRQFLSKPLVASVASLCTIPYAWSTLLAIHHHRFHVLHQKRKCFPNAGLLFKLQGVISMGEKVKWKNLANWKCILHWTNYSFYFLSCVIIPQRWPHIYLHLHI